MTRVAVVTGSNKGIGYGIVRALCKQWQGDVYLTSRDVGRGEAAVASLKEEGLAPCYHQLDITDSNSIEKLKTFIVEKYGGLDILVNNAGIAYKQASTAPFLEQAEVTMATNYHATINACNILFPILRSHSRVVNVSSMISAWMLKKVGPQLKPRVLAVKSVPEVSALMNEFVESVRSGDFEARGWPQSAYGNSKLGLTCATIILQSDIDKDESRKDIVVNACCPGFVDTDMTSHKGKLTIDQGADTPVYLALLPQNEQHVRGKYVSERKVQPWE